MPTNWIAEAKALPQDERKRILQSIPEVDFHHHLAQLFRNMEPEYWVEVTHGTDEFGQGPGYRAPRPVGAGRHRCRR